MIVLGVAVHWAHTGGMALEPYLARLVELGVGAIEAQLSPEMRSDEIAHWSATIDLAARHGLAVGFHAPMAPQHPAWPAVLGWASASPARSPAAVIVHGCSGPRRDPRLAPCTADHLRRLADAAPLAMIALENGANTAGGPIAHLRAWAARRRRLAADSRPQGVGSGMGAPRAALPLPSSYEPVDPPPAPRPRQARWNAAGSRDAAWEICAGVERSNCVVAWDLAHDWIAGRQPGVAQAAVPTTEALRRVGYVRVHDVDDGGADHCLLVMGNVPYTTQLRALMGAGYGGTVCLAARYTAAMRPHGGRWQALERSLNILKQTLKLS